MKQFAGWVAVALFWVSPAFASTPTAWEENDSFWITYNFSTVAFGKSVASVSAHTGVLRQGGENCSGLPPLSGDWDDVQDVVMTNTGGHFFGKSRLDSHTGECQISVSGPVVQYWITFTDGSSMITQSTMVQYTDSLLTVQSAGVIDWQASVSANDAAFASVTDAGTTAATRLHYQWSD